MDNVWLLLFFEAYLKIQNEHHKNHILIGVTLQIFHHHMGLIQIKKNYIIMDQYSISENFIILVFLKSQMYELSQKSHLLKTLRNVADILSPTIKIILY